MDEEKNVEIEAAEEKPEPAATPEDMSLVEKAGRMARLMHRYIKLNTEAHGGIGDPLQGQGRVLPCSRQSLRPRRRSSASFLACASSPSPSF